MLDRRPALGLWWLLAVVVLAASVPSYAMPPSEEVIERLRAEGILDRHREVEASARRRGLNQINSHRLTAGGMNAVVGNLNVLVILVDFDDELATAGGSYSDSTYFNDLLFSTNNPGYSMNDHYFEMSYGNVTISGRAVGWLRMPQTYDYYVDGQRGFGNYPHNAQKMAEDAIDSAEAFGVDWSLYDNDNDGFLDGLFIVHASAGYEATGNVNQIHSHAWGIPNPRVYDGVTISSYTTEPEEKANGLPIDIGVYSHEYGHFLGLPDLYDTDYSSEGLGRWCLMAGGSWANGGTTPAHMSVWCKMILGWVTPINVTSNMTAAPIPQIQTDAVAYRLWAGGSIGNEYFLVENRQKVLFDSYIRGTGLCIYHIDDFKGGNEQEWYPGLPTNQHFLVALEQADGNWGMEHGSNSGDAADTWPGTGSKREFSEFSVPDSRAYNTVTTQIAVWDISDGDSLMTANLDIFFSTPHFDLLSNTFGDDGNSDGRPDPGENVTMVVSQKNLGAPISDALYSVSAADSALQFSDSTSLVGSVPTGVTADNAGDPFDFFVPIDFPPKAVDFYLTVTADGGAYVKTDTVRINVGPDQLIVVDDDADLQTTADYDETYLFPLLDSLQIAYSTWDVKVQGAPTDLTAYPMVIWMTGNKRDDPVSGPDTTLTPTERATLATYLDNGGHLWLTGTQIALMLDQADSAFMHDYLHCTYGGPMSDFRATGVDGDVVGDGTFYALAGAGGAANQTGKDLVVPVGGGIACFTENGNPARIAGVRYDGAYKVLFHAWGFEGIGDISGAGIGADPKSVLINRAIDWLLYDAVFSGVSLAPLVVNPGQDATHLVDTSIDLHWNFLHPLGDPQDSLQVEVGSDNEWTTAEYWSHGPVAGPDTTVHYAGPTAVTGNTYYWRVRVYAGGTWSDWSVSTWHMNAGPSEPVLSSPVSDMISTSSPTALTTGNAADPEGDACTYDFEVYADSALASLITSVAGITQGVGTTSWNVDSTLTEHDRFWWRSRAHDDYFSSNWSDAASFYVDAVNEAPTAPTLTGPADSSEVPDSLVQLTWTGATDPDLVDTLRYRVQVDTQASLATAVVYDSVSTENLDLVGALEGGRTYWWNVIVFDKGNLEAPSATFTFDTEVPYLAGDADDNGSVTSADVIYMVNFVFKGGAAPLPLNSGDVDASCAITSADIIYLVGYVFKGGPAPQQGCAG